MKIIQLGDRWDGKMMWAWYWRFLWIREPHGWSISYYPDYEDRAWTLEFTSR